MTIQFGVAVVYHCSGASVKNLCPRRFADYDSAFHYGKEVEPNCNPTVYVILDNTYAFHCERSRVVNAPYKVMSFTSHNWGMTETMVWWGKFLENPYYFVSLAEKI